MPIYLSNTGGDGALKTCQSYDVVIVGGGAAGIGSAIGARQSAPEARILLIESEGCLGGAATHRGVTSYCGLFTIQEHSRKCVGSIWEDLKERLQKVGATPDGPVRHRGIFQMVEPEGLKYVLDEVMADYNIDVLLHTPVVGAKRQLNGLITSVEIQERRGRREISAKAFVDCSGDCDLAAHAGASTRYGNNGKVNLGSLSVRYGGIPADVHPRALDWRDAILAAKGNSPELQKIIRKNESVLIRLPQSGDVVTFMASAAYDARDSASTTAAEQSGRRQAQEYLKILRTLPGLENMYIVTTGPNFGTREARHVNAKYQLTENDVLTGRHFQDVIALCGWGFEYHDVEHENWASTFKIPKAGVFDVPFQCLQSIDTPNLFAAGRCVDGDQWAGSAVRVMGTALATGQAAGVAAGLVAKYGDNWRVQDVQECLLKHGALLDSNNLPDGGRIERAC